MKKRILCLVLAVVLVGSAIGFFVYDKVGNTFNYAKNPSKYVTISNADAIKTLYTGGKTQPDAVTETDLQAAVAKALASLQKDGTVGIIRLYDTLYVKYYATVEVDGKVKVITKTETLEPTKSTSVQLGADSDLARLFVEFLLGKDGSTTSYRTYTKDEIMKGDKIVFSYTVDGEGGDARENVKRNVIGATFLDDIEADGAAAGLTAKFLEKLANREAKINEAITLELGEGDSKKTYVITVGYALRDKIVGGGVEDGDHLRFVYNEITKDGEEDKEGKDTIHTGVLSENLDKEFGTGFYAKLKTLEIGKKTAEKFSTTITKEDGTTETKEYKVEIQYVEGREDTSSLTDEQIERAERYIEFDKTYAEDSDAKADNDEKLELKGKTVHYYVAVTGVKTYAYNYTNIVDAKNGLKYTAEKDSNLEKYLTAYADYVKAQKAYDDAKALTGDKAKTAEELQKLEEAAATAKEAYLDAEVVYIDTLKPTDEEELKKFNEGKLKAYYDALKALIEANKALKAADEKTDALKEAVTAAEAALKTALNAYAEEKKVSLEDVKYVDIVARDAYEKKTTEGLEDGKKDKLAYEIAKEVWKKLLEEAGKTVKYPGKAVRVAYRGLIDGYKTNYYENRDKSPYKDYSSFKSYLKNSAYAGKDYKAEITEEAKQIVLEQLVLYRLVEMYDVTLTSSQESMLTIYKLYMSEKAAETARTSYLFDNVMQKIAEGICPAVKKN